MKKEAARKEENKNNILNYSILVLFGIFLLIGILFYVSLSVVKSGEASVSGSVSFSPEDEARFNFGAEDILFSIAFALFMTGFLTWIKSIMRKNTYLGAIIGAVGSFILGYAFHLRYSGYYSNGFLMVAGFVVLIYLGMNFYRYKN